MSDDAKTVDISIVLGPDVTFDQTDGLRWLIVPRCKATDSRTGWRCTLPRRHERGHLGSPSLRSNEVAMWD